MIACMTNEGKKPGRHKVVRPNGGLTTWTTLSYCARYFALENLGLQSYRP